jgi:poly(hydroxyalkanoate) depolymerase family esterase
MSPMLRLVLTITLGLSYTLGLSCTGAASAGQLQQKLFTAKSYSGSRDRQYQVFIPTSYTGQVAVPMVMVLHGCKQTEVNMINETRFKDLAERDTFIVVYPFITSYDGMRDTNCWGFFLDQHIHQGAGEVEDLHQIALEVEAAFKVDANRRYVTGLSSGAGMSVALAVAQNEYFAAAGSVEGLPYSETSSSVGFFCANKGTSNRFPPTSPRCKPKNADRRSSARSRSWRSTRATTASSTYWAQKISATPGSVALASIRALSGRRIARRKGWLAPRQSMGHLSARSSRRSFTTASTAICSAPERTTGSATTADNSPIRPDPAPASCSGRSSRRIPSPRIPLQSLQSRPRRPAELP